jgi:hypothetical protein
LGKTSRKLKVVCEGEGKTELTIYRREQQKEKVCFFFLFVEKLYTFSLLYYFYEVENLRLWQSINIYKYTLLDWFECLASQRV